MCTYNTYRYITYIRTHSYDTYISTHTYTTHTCIHTYNTLIQCTYAHSYITYICTHSHNIYSSTHTHTTHIHSYTLIQHAGRPSHTHSHQLPTAWLVKTLYKMAPQAPTHAPPFLILYLRGPRGEAAWLPASLLCQLQWKCLVWRRTEGPRGRLTLLGKRV